jgi:Outer membrane protein beta-barrel domain
MKRALILIAGISIVMMGHAQQHLSLGPTAGFGHSWLSMDQGTPGYDKAFHAQYNIGAKLVYSIETHWGLSADLKFSSEGGRFSTSQDNGELVYRANYIRIPLQGIYFFGEYGDKVHPKISVGPSFGFLVGGKYKTKVNEQTMSEGDSKDLFKGFDVGANIAAGANIRLTPNTWLNTDLTYYHGLTDISDNNNNNEIRNRGIGINVGVMFGIDAPKAKK